MTKWRIYVELTNMSNEELFNEYRCALTERVEAGCRNRFANGPSEEMENLDERIEAIENIVTNRGFDIAYARRKAAEKEKQFIERFIEFFNIEDDEEIFELFKPYDFLKGEGSL